MIKLIILTLLFPFISGLNLPSVPDHGVLPGLSGQGVGGGADDHGLGSNDSPTFAGLTLTGDLIIVSNPPASSASSGIAGMITWDSSYFYVCIATDSWKRTALTTWGITDVLLLDDGASKLLLDDGSSFLLIRP